MSDSPKTTGKIKPDFGALCRYVEKLEKKLEQRSEEIKRIDSNVHVLMQLIEQKDAEIERLKSEMLFVPVFPEWIPVSDPPKKNGYFWCSIVDDAGCKWADKRLFSVENGWFTIGEQVTHWMPLPQPPEDKC